MQYCEIYLQGVNKIRKVLNKNSFLATLHEDLSNPKE
jgi:hypothetical protein